MNGIKIRSARLEDAERIIEIYGYYIKNTAITFEYEIPSISDFQDRMAGIMKRYPYLVLEEDGVVQGYAYAGAFIARAACDWSCEMSIYLDKDARGRGFGRMLYEDLEHRLKDMGMVNLYACIAYTEKEDAYVTKNSIQFHEHLGFSVVGEFKQCGYKFGHWYSLIWVEKQIAEHKDDMISIF